MFSSSSCVHDLSRDRAVSRRSLYSSKLHVHVGSTGEASMHNKYIQYQTNNPRRKKEQDIVRSRREREREKKRKGSRSASQASPGSFLSVRLSVSQSVDSVYRSISGIFHCFFAWFICEDWRDNRITDRASISYIH